MRKQLVTGSLAGYYAGYFGGMSVTSQNAKPCRLLQCQRGAVLMEYVILSVGVVLPLIASAMFVINPSGFDVSVQTFDINPATGAITSSGTTSTTFGLLGDVFVGWYQRIMCGVALPIP